MMYRPIAALMLMTALASPALAAQGSEDWPCIQRKVPELSLGQIWNGPELPAEAADWSKDAEISALVRELSARRMPVEEAQGRIRDFAEKSGEAAEQRLLILVRGLFDHMNRERADVMSGISRYARRQVELAERLRQELSEVDTLRNKSDANPTEVAQRSDRLVWETRLFEERAQSLSFVCEVPTLIEQRLFALSRAIGQTMNSLRQEKEAAPNDKR
jgi:hypothetical protein